MQGKLVLEAMDGLPNFGSPHQQWRLLGTLAVPSGGVSALLQAFSWITCYGQQHFPQDLDLLH